MVSYDVADRAKDIGVKMNLVDTGGYPELTKQISQIEDCVTSGAELVVIGAISSTVSTDVCRKWCGNQENVRFLIKVESL
ncbi:hypothetical protein [Sinorhizobium sojae]|uniref:hypothetical protein n=1 Tax=Sinorhizobium sojae TaxID=716925 RepID=UPI001AEC4E83|nr:hypothetical protein [Sinorhizobium sojae]